MHSIVIDGDYNCLVIIINPTFILPNGLQAASFGPFSNRCRGEDGGGLLHIHKNPAAAIAR